MHTLANTAKPLISIVIPIYNEEKNIIPLYQQLLIESKKLDRYNFEFIMINDGSTDQSWFHIQQIAKTDERIIGINFTKNFGKQCALTAGYHYARGNASVTLDADMQHPPHLIASMIDNWQKGYEIIYVQSAIRSHGFIKKACSSIYANIINKISDINLPHRASDFLLIDRKVITILLQSTEKSRYIRGMIAWTGFKSTTITITFPSREHGVTTFTWSKLLKLAVDGIANFSMAPLKIAAYVGMFVIATGMGMFLFITGESLLYRAHYPLFKWLVTIIYIFIGILFILLWIIGEYIGRIYEELKGRPLYIIKDIVCINKEVLNQVHHNAPTLYSSRNTLDQA